MEKYKIDKKSFSEEDLTTILMGISSIPAVMKSDSFIHTYGKINSLIPEERKEASHFYTEQMHIDFSHWMGNRDLEDYIETIKTALIKSRILSFEDINHSGEETKRQVEPYQLILKGSQWYFQGYCYSGEIRDGMLAIILYDHEVYFKNQDKARLVSLNKAYPDIVVTDPTTFSVLGKIVI